MQLVAYGAQDIYLTGNPQITFFKVVYRRHTNFAMESIQQTFNGTVGFGKRVTCTISRNGDLVYKVYLEVGLDGYSRNIVPEAHLGHALIKEVEVEIGGQKIDKHISQWLQVWNELSNSDYKNCVVATTPVNLRIDQVSGTLVEQDPMQVDSATGHLINTSGNVATFQPVVQVNDALSQGVEVAYADVALNQRGKNGHGRQ